ncbi:MAG: NTP transferase domain-containing protein [Gemmatimonadetes bacterium]|nr:NTP transferase domain-containing protein [Gemmatimonadota bacterium]
MTEHPQASTATAERLGSPPVAAVVLAAGQSKRMRSRLVKVLHPLAGKPVIAHVLGPLRALGVTRTVVVVGHQRELVQDAVSGLSAGAAGAAGSRETVEFAYQDQALGTGHALLQCRPMLGEFDGDLLVTAGDTPLLREESLRMLLRHHRERGAAATILTAVLEDPTGYGRIVRRGSAVTGIVEHRDATPEQLRIREVNTSIYCFRAADALPALDRLERENRQGEYYLTDLPILLRDAPGGVQALTIEDPQEVLGINDREQLAYAESVLRRRIRQRVFAGGVTMLQPETILLDAEVSIGPDSVLYPGVIVEGPSVIGAECVIGPYSRIVASHIGTGVELKGWNFVAGTTIASGAILQPYVRKGSD